MSTTQIDIIREGVSNGVRLRVLGERLGVSRERARQLIAASGLYDAWRENRPTSANAQKIAHRRDRYSKDRLIATLKSAVKSRSRLNESTGCVEWTGQITPSGYGQICIGKRTRLVLGLPVVSSSWFYAHRAVMFLTHGFIPEGMTVDHLCHNRRCVNPAHLRFCTLGENVARKWFHVMENRPDVPEAVKRRRSQAPKPSDGAASPVEDDLAPDEEATAAHRTSLQEGAA